VSAAALPGGPLEPLAGEEAREAFADQLRRLGPQRQSGALLGFLRARIARRLHIDPEDVSPRAQLIALGLSSIDAVELKAELERELRLPFRSSILFDYPTLELLEPFLLERLRARASAPRATSAPQPTPQPMNEPPEADDPEARLRRLLGEE
jgi:acyl carrier protein